jgi:hypothetical protein
MQASTPSASSLSRQWADYSDDKDDMTPRSYCEVLRSGLPPFPAPVVAPSPSPVAQGGARLWSDALALLAAGVGTVTPVGAVGGATTPRMDGPASGLVGGVDVAGIPAGGVGPWIHVGGQERSRGWMEELPVLQIHDDLPPDLAGLCFNCLLPADHIARNCTRRRHASDTARVGTMPVTVPKDGHGRLVAGCGTNRVELAYRALRRRAMASRGGSCAALASTPRQLGRRVDGASSL